MGVHEAYANVAQIYKGMVPKETLLAQKAANPFMTGKLRSLKENAKVLDAACGIGWDIIAIKNGLPDQDFRRSFQACASDASRFMIEAAKENIASARKEHGIGDIDIRQSSFFDLFNERDWQSEFDLVIAPNAINQLPDGLDLQNYDNYMLNSLAGLRSTLKPEGILMLDSRDWEKTFSLHFKKTVRENTHNGVLYRAEYTWDFGNAPDTRHEATMVISQEGNENLRCAEKIYFAGRTVRQLCELFHRANLRTNHIHDQVRGLNAEPFVTFELSPI